MNDELTLGGYMETHGRAAAFAGSDGQPYSVDVIVDEEPGANARFGAALLFVRWSPQGDRPVGHVESDYLAWGSTAESAEARIKSLSLYDVKEALDEALAAAARRRSPGG